MDFSIRRTALKILLDEECIITHFTAYKYIKDFIKSEFLLLKTVVNDSINDLKVALGLYEPADTPNSRLEELCKK